MKQQDGNMAQNFIVYKQEQNRLSGKEVHINKTLIAIPKIQVNLHGTGQDEVSI